MTDANLCIQIVNETPASLGEYGSVPIAFLVESAYRIRIGADGERILSEAEVTPYWKDYDAYPDEGPSAWAERFDVSNWGFFAAFEGERRVGGAAAAWKTPGVDMLEGRDDLVCLWDLRVDPGYRGSGVGKMLFDHAAAWARERGSRELKIETQNINVRACRFYAKQNCILRQTNCDAYPPEIDEIQMLWYLDL